jgi:hypothetical protein
MAGNTGVLRPETAADMAKGFKTAPLWAGKRAGFATLFIIRAAIERPVGGDCPRQVGGMEKPVTKKRPIFKNHQLSLAKSVFLLYTRRQPIVLLRQAMGYPHVKWRSPP